MAAEGLLPDALDTVEARQQILSWAGEQSGATSARGLERALARWLGEQARSLTSQSPG